MFVSFPDKTRPRNEEGRRKFANCFRQLRLRVANCELRNVRRRKEGALDFSRNTLNKWLDTDTHGFWPRLALHVVGASKKTSTLFTVENRFDNAHHPASAAPFLWALHTITSAGAVSRDFLIRQGQRDTNTEEG